MMTNITIPPAALEAGARAIAVDGGIADPEWRFYKEAARAAFLAMLAAWEGMEIDDSQYGGDFIILPLPQEASDDQ
jgi:hypothetical protein